MKNRVTYRRKAGSSIFLLIFLSSLFSNIFFVHSHWYEGNLIAIHAHPYRITDYEGNKKENNHSTAEYELYDLIYSTPILALEFFDVELNPTIAEIAISYGSNLLSHNDTSPSLFRVRGPPFFGSWQVRQIVDRSSQLAEVKEFIDFL